MGNSLCLEQLVEQFEKHEAWRNGHDATMDYCELEDLIAVALFLFDRISKIDEKWHLEAFAPNSNYELLAKRNPRVLYGRWLGPGRLLLGRLQKLEKEGFKFEESERFRDCCQEVGGILTEDAVFFSVEQLAALRDQAIECHRAGATVEGLAD